MSNQPRRLDRGVFGQVIRRTPMYAHPVSVLRFAIPARTDYRRREQDGAFFPENES